MDGETLPGGVVARAYSGPGHGTCWPVPAGAPPAATVALAAERGPCRYRLVLRADGRPARDGQGSYLYVPALERGPRTSTVS